MLKDFVPEELVRATMAKRFGRMADKLSDVGVHVPNLKNIVCECNDVKVKLVHDFIRSATPEEIIKAASRINSIMNR